MKHPKQVGMSCKNSRFIKASLTPYEQGVVTRHIADNKKRWEYLFSLNKWKPQNPKKLNAPR